ncbi:hypothetical protein PGT21_034002 [Puccinia graminis f. sp. tritici]|uniref:Uncharacterized protein n=1 Tax=Puccinia graminis f. sp. tritici TaxID=56615 RepID=A0A5B0MHU6_PUCGR|nr:hypothetical protein PGT21_034002 [Puccinia graminis f. sp. tritici]
MIEIVHQIFTAQLKPPAAQTILKHPIVPAQSDPPVAGHPPHQPVGHRKLT